MNTADFLKLYKYKAVNKLVCQGKHERIPVSQGITAVWDNDESNTVEPINIEMNRSDVYKCVNCVYLKSAKNPDKLGETCHNCLSNTNDKYDKIEHTLFNDAYIQ